MIQATRLHERSAYDRYIHVYEHVFIYPAEYRGSAAQAACPQQAARCGHQCTTQAAPLPVRCIGGRRVLPVEDMLPVQPPAQGLGEWVCGAWEGEFAEYIYIYIYV